MNSDVTNCKYLISHYNQFRDFFLQIRQIRDSICAIAFHKAPRGSKIGALHARGLSKQPRFTYRAIASALRLEGELDVPLSAPSYPPFIDPFTDLSCLRHMLDYRARDARTMSRQIRRFLASHVDNTSARARARAGRVFTCLIS